MQKSLEEGLIQDISEDQFTILCIFLLTNIQAVLSCV